MNYLIQQRPFPADQLLQVFLISFQQDDRVGLTWFGHAILSASANPAKSQFKRLAQEVSVFALVDRGDDKPLIYVIIASIVGRLLRSEVFNTDDVFLSAIYAFQFLEDNATARPAAEALISFYERVWPEILRDRAFSMRSPVTNGPIILAAIRKGETAMQLMANMVLATEAATRHGLSDDLRDQLSKAAAKRSKPQRDAPTD